MDPVFPFVIGCERSGTTLLRAMLDAHPAMAVPDESHFIAALAARRHRLETHGTVDAGRLLGVLEASPGFRRFGIPLRAVGESLRADPPRDLAAAVRRLYRLYSDARGKDRYGDKTTTYVFHLASIGALLPDARFVHLIRDGRNVALSLLQVRWGPGTVEEAAAWWRARVAAARRAGALLGPDRYLEVRFEALASSPELQLRRLAGFLDLPWTEHMLRYHEGASALLEGMPDRRRYDHRNILRPPSDDLRDWRRDLPAAAQLTFEALAGDLLEELDYERRFPSVAVLACREERRRLLGRPRRSA